MANKVSIFWFRRDLRLEDNRGLTAALNVNEDVIPLFIFDSEILSELPKDDARVSFIHGSLESINKALKSFDTSMLCIHGNPVEIWKTLIDQYNISSVYFNKDYEPYAINRDERISRLLESEGIEVHPFKDQVIFEEDEVLKNDNTPYTVYTPYKNKWLSQFKQNFHAEDIITAHFYRSHFKFPSLSDIGFEKSQIIVPDFTLDIVDEYGEYRDFPAKDATSYLSTHLRFGTVSIREIINPLKPGSTFFNELIWREFFMQILYHFPKVIHENFRAKYNQVPWRNNQEEFEKWCQGKTGYPMVDAGMRQLNATGLMHNRVRMVTAGFLCKHLLIDWRWGEAYFASKLLDYDASANNGNWQWAAGTGCDAAPYFRIFNPSEQLKKFDKNLDYVKKWVPEFGSFEYPLPIVDHPAARKRALEAYKGSFQ